MLFLAHCEHPWLISSYMQTWCDLQLHGEFLQCGGPSHFLAAVLILDMFNKLDKSQLSAKTKKVHVSSGGGVEQASKCCREGGGKEHA